MHFERGAGHGALYQQLDKTFTGKNFVFFQEIVNLGESNDGEIK